MLKTVQLLDKNKIAQAAMYLGVSTKTLRRWGKSGKLVGERTSGDQRYYTKDQLESFAFDNKLFDQEATPVLNKKTNQKPSFNFKYLFLLLLAVPFVLQGRTIFQGRTGLSSDGDRMGSSEVSNSKPSVLAATTGLGGIDDEYTFTVNIPSKFNKNITAPNVVYSVNGETGDVDVELVAGTGISLDGLKVTNSGIVTLSAGGGITIDGNKITNSGITSLTAGSGISVSGSTITNTLDLSASGWTDSGTTLKLTTITDSVGIGIALPTSTLHVVGTTNLAGSVILGEDSGDTITINAGMLAGSSITPQVDLGADLGSTLKRFNNLWVANINSNSSQAFSGQTTFSYAPQSALIAEASVLINPTTSAADGQLLALGLAGYQRALIDEDGDMILGYLDATSAPASDYPLNIYGHSGTRVAYVDTTGALNMGTALSSSGALTITPNAGSNLNITLSTTGDLAVNTNQLYVDTSTGYVGIGTTAPAYKLNVAGSFAIRPSTGVASLLMGAVGVEGNNILAGLGDSYYLNFTQWNGSTMASALYLFNGDKVGIGTTAPTSKLHVSGAVTGKALAIFDETGDQNILVASASGVAKFVIQHDGKVGIGTTAPNTALVVTGVAKITQSISLPRTTDSPVTSLGGLLYSDKDGITAVTGGTVDALVLGGEGVQIRSHLDANALVTFMPTLGTVGIGTTAPTSKLHVTGAVTGKALSIFNETGDQALLTASASGVPMFTIDHSGNVKLGTPTGTVAQLHAESSSTTYKGFFYNTNTTDGDGLRVRTDYQNNASIIMNVENAGVDMFVVQGGASGVGRVLMPNGTVGIGTTAPGYLLTLNNNTTTPAFALSDDDIAHGLTTLAATDVFSHLTSLSTTAGGTEWTTISDTDAQALSIRGVMGSTNPTDTTSAIKIIGAKSDGSTGMADLAAAETVFQVANNDNTSAISVLGNNKIGLGIAIPSYNLDVAGDGVLVARFGETPGGNTTYINIAGLTYGLFLGYDYNGGTITNRISSTRDIRFDVTNGGTFGGGTTGLYIGSTGKVGIGTTAPTSKLHVSGAVTGKALAIFDETGDQALLTASASGVTKLTVLHNGLVNGTAGGLATFTKAGTIDDTDFTDTEVDGLLGIDTTNHRIYFREGAAWSFAAKAGGFQIPKEEVSNLEIGDFMLPYVESYMADGAIHGLYAKWSEVKETLLAEIKDQISKIKIDIEKFAEKFTTKEICLSGENDSETCIKKEQLDELIKLLPTPTPTTSTSEESLPAQAGIRPPSEVSPTPSLTPDVSATPSATPEVIYTPEP